uniref:hypothetical protein n=1 Tax=Pedobacter schmidteae TaxID=2201271 RepID=UPI0013CEC323|nr:hypothetical protein [Pedobacter schmidteae]
MKKSYLLFLLVICSVMVLNSCKKKEDASGATGKVTFTIDGKSYEGIAAVTINPACQTSKTIVISDASAAHTITLNNYTATSGTVYNPLIGDTNNSCTKIWAVVTDGSAANGYMSLSGSWQVSGSTFTLSCTASVPSSNTSHSITATGKLP